MAGFECTLTLVPADAIAPDGTIQLHCTGHEPPLLIGEWPRALADEDEAAHFTNLEAAIKAHRPQHAEAAS